MECHSCRFDTYLQYVLLKSKLLRTVKYLGMKSLPVLEGGGGGGGGNVNKNVCEGGELHFRKRRQFCVRSGIYGF